MSCKRRIISFRICRMRWSSWRGWWRTKILAFELLTILCLSRFLRCCRYWTRILAERRQFVRTTDCSNKFGNWWMKKRISSRSWSSSRIWHRWAWACCSSIKMLNSRCNLCRWHNRWRKLHNHTIKKWMKKRNMRINKSSSPSNQW